MDCLLKPGQPWTVRLPMAAVLLAFVTSVACSAKPRSADPPPFDRGAPLVGPPRPPPPARPAARPAPTAVRKTLDLPDDEMGDGPRTELSLFYSPVGAALGAGLCSVPCALLGIGGTFAVTFGATDETFSWGEAQLIEGTTLLLWTHAGLLALGDVQVPAAALAVGAPFVGLLGGAAIGKRLRPRAGTIALINSAWMWTALLLGTNAFAPDLRRNQPEDLTRVIGVMLGADLAAVAAGLLTRDLVVTRKRVIGADVAGLLGFGLGLAVGEKFDRPAAIGTLGALVGLGLVLGTGWEPAVPEAATGAVRLAPWLMPDGAGVWLVR